jgi:hypothetical protein
LRDLDQPLAASVIEACSIRAEFVDIVAPIGGGEDVELYNVVIEAPGRIFKRLNGDYSEPADQVEHAIRACSAGLGVAVSRINWVAKTPAAAAGVEPGVSVVISALESAQIRMAWSRALERRAIDPAGAITAARSLLESVLKHILDAEGVDYSPAENLPKLYGKAAEVLKLAPAQHGQDVKRVLGGCHTVVDGLASLRNNLGDAHGPSPQAVAPAQRHAALAVNAAGTIAMFLVETWQEQRPDGI